MKTLFLTKCKAAVPLTTGRNAAKKTIFSIIAGFIALTAAAQEETAKRYCEAA
jgi:hypothetical protein